MTRSPEFFHGTNHDLGEGDRLLPANTLSQRAIGKVDANYDYGGWALTAENVSSPDSPLHEVRNRGDAVYIEPNEMNAWSWGRHAKGSSRPRALHVTPDDTATPDGRVDTEVLTSGATVDRVAWGPPGTQPALPGQNWNEIGQDQDDFRRMASADTGGEPDDGTREFFALDRTRESMRQVANYIGAMGNSTDSVAQPAEMSKAAKAGQYPNWLPLRLGNDTTPKNHAPEVFRRQGIPDDEQHERAVHTLATGLNRSGIGRALNDNLFSRAMPYLDETFGRGGEPGWADPKNQQKESLLESRSAYGTADWDVNRDAV